MVGIIAGVVLFLLFAAGVLAYQNSRMIKEQEADASATRISYLMYSVYNQDFADGAERPEAVPLFQFNVSYPQTGLPAADITDKTYALCRVPAGTGEMALFDAQIWMMNNIRQSVLKGLEIEHVSFPKDAIRKGEKELIALLETAVKEEAEHANHHQR